MAERDPHELAQSLEREADKLASEGKEVKQAVEETRAEWERKRQDESVPGAPPPDKSESDDRAEPDDA